MAVETSPDPGAAAGTAPWWRFGSLWPAALGVLLLAATLALGGAGEAVADLGQLLLYGVAFVLALRAIRRVEPALRLGWRLLAAVSGFALGAYVVLLGMQAAGLPLPGNDQLIPLLLAVNALALAALVALSPPQVRGARTRVGLDGIIAGGALLFLILATTERPLQPGEAGEAAPLADLLYPAMDAASLMVCGIVVLNAGPRATPLWYHMFLAATGFVFIADGLYAAGAISALGVEASSLLYLGLMATAANLAGSWPAVAARPERLATQVAVYVPFGLAIAASVYDYLENDGVDFRAFALLMALVGLVVARTVLVLRENRRLARNLRESDQFKTQLLRFISHEIANPLSPLKLQMRMLKDAPSPTGWEVVDRSLHRLESLSSDVRLMALAETGRLVKAFAPADLVPRVAGAVNAYRPLAEAKGVALEAMLPSGPLVVPVDGERFDQVVDNLLSNAVKFTPRGGRIAVRLEPRPEAPALGARLQVEDTGLGMDGDQVRRLFSAFGRVHGEAQPGLGLGLYLCKAIVDGHGGRIAASSEGRGRGSTLLVDWPGQPHGPDAPAIGPAPQRTMAA